MKISSAIAIVGLLLLSSSAEAAPARAGAVRLDATWHVGASAGQYASGDTAEKNWLTNDYGIDAHLHSTRRSPSYGIQSRSTLSALVVEGANSRRVAIVTNDLYIPQDLVNTRVAELLADRDRDIALGLAAGTPTGIGEENLTIAVSHSHTSPYYSTPSWGVWTFQDVFDIRFFEFIARRMADAVIQAAADLRPVRIAGTVRYFDRTQRHSFGPQVADDGTPAGYPETDNDKFIHVLRFDDLSAPQGPKPLAVFIAFGMHPEMLDGNDIHSGEWTNVAMEIVERETGAVPLFAQVNVGSSETGRDARAQPPEQRAEYAHREYAQMTRAGTLVGEEVLRALADIDAQSPRQGDEPVADFGAQWAPWQENFEVRIVDLRLAPPSLRLSPSVSNCRMEQTVRGNPGIPIAGLPDCEFPLTPVADELNAAGIDPRVTYETLRQAGVPIPDNVSAPSYTGLQEALQVHLQAIRFGSVGITVCPCEQWADQSRNLKSRLDRVAGDFWEGFDWAEQTIAAAGHPRAGGPWCEQNPDTTWSCANPKNPSQDLPPVGDEKYRRMRAQIHNDAAGWDSLDYAPYAETEEPNPAAVKGNYTHEELTDFGYDLVIPLSMANDYWGYIATYREFQRGDHYRKALTGLGPHSSDFLATRLSRMAASLNGAPPVEVGPKDLAYSWDREHQRARARAIGAIHGAALPVYESTIPPTGEPVIVDQPVDVERFTAARIAWLGGDNYTDLPNARVERLRDGGDPDVADDWGAFGDGTLGEVQTRVHFPGDPAQAADGRIVGAYDWIWEAQFETFVGEFSLPDLRAERQTATPTGTYRFVIEGKRRAAAASAPVPYVLTSTPFTVKPWNGITIERFVRTAAGVEFDVGPVSEHTYAGVTNTYVIGPIDYPDSYTSTFPEFIVEQRDLATYGPGIDDDQQFCFHCRFRPWADTGEVASAELTVVRSGGAVETVPAICSSGTCSAAFSLATGEVTYVEAGAVRDAAGNRNGMRSAELSGP